MRSCFFVFLLCFFSSAACSSDLCGNAGMHFYEIANAADSSSLKAVLTELEKGSCFNASTRELQMADGVQVFGDSELIYKKWRISKYDKAKKGFLLQLDIGQHSFSLPASKKPVEIYNCPNNILTTGIRIISIADSALRVIEFWSCGSAGCSYGYFYSENTNEETKNFCQQF